MSPDVELSVLVPARAGRGFVASFAVTDEMIVALGGLAAATVMASSNGRDFAPRKPPHAGGLRDALAVADSIWACGEYGQLAVSRDHGASWKLLETDTQLCLFGLALAADGAVWVVGDEGYVARVLGQRVQRVDFKTNVRLSAVYAVRDEVVAVGFDGQLWRWRDGTTIAVPCGAPTPLTALAISSKGTWIAVGDGGFVARAPDGQWFSRVASGVEVDLEAVVGLPDGSLIAVGGEAHILRSIDDGRTWHVLEHQLGAGHLWGVERFGGGVLIGGDDGVVIRLAPPGDATWRERANVFGGARPLDAAFAAGPEHFIVTGLAAYLDELDAEGAVDEPLDADGGDGDESDDDEDIAAWADEDGDAAAAALLSSGGDAASFRENYGMALPADAAALFDAVAHRDPWTTFAELRLDAERLPHVGEQNLFELILRRNQHAYLGTELVEAFCGVFAIGSQRNGDAYLLELYEWDGPRQVLHFDHETYSISKYIADSLDSLVYLTALVKGGEEQRLSKDAYRAGLRRLHGKVSPTWHFNLETQDAAFVPYEPKRRDTEFFFYRSRWITALLKNDGVTELRDLPGLFMADFNQVVPPDQLPARLEACEKFVPTALYAMWRAYLFDEPELARYLEIGRAHRARLARDAAALIEELHGGRNELGTISDVRAYVEAFRALDLDPRRADDRKTEADVRAKAEAARRQVALEELAEAPVERWADLAWEWLGDGVAHRALLERLDQTGEHRPHAEQIAALDDLRALRDDERAVALPRLAAELTPELEAVLVGSLVRNDALDGVLERPARELDDAGHGAPGWDAIDAALRPIYGDAEPVHYGTKVPWSAGGDDPLHGISAYARTEPVPHWHFITYGFSDLFRKETDAPDVSGFGFELTLRLARPLDEEMPPVWAINFLQNLGRYVWKSGNPFAAGHKMGLNGPIALGATTQITAVCFADDPELGAFSSEFGAARFVQVVGITDDEYQLIQEWSTTSLIELLGERLPLLMTDLARASVLADPATAAEIARRVERDGSAEDLAVVDDLELVPDGEALKIELGALYATSLPRAMRGRIRHARGYELYGSDAILRLLPSERAGFHRDEEGAIVVGVTPELAREIEARLHGGLAGSYRFGDWLEIAVTPSLISDAQGRAVSVRGVADPGEARRLIEAANADVDEAEDDDAEDADGERPDAAKVAAALAMSNRALRLAPDDASVQYTHAMLLLDGDRAEGPDHANALFSWLPRCAPEVRLRVAVQLSRSEHARFVEAADLVEPAGDVSQEVWSEFGAALLEQAPERLVRFAPLLPDDARLFVELAARALQVEQSASARALFERLLALPVPPEPGEERDAYLEAMHDASVQARIAREYDTAIRIVDRTQAVADENPHLYHAAASAYVAIGDHGRAFAQVKLAVQHDYHHLDELEVDRDLGPLLEWPEFKALFREWRVRREGN